MKRQFLKFAAAAAVGTLLGACGGTDEGDDVSPGTLLDVAARSGEISALVAIARKAGLESALSDPAASLTVLAPTNEAFSLLAGQLGFRTTQAMVDALSAAQLEAILRYHVLPTQLSRAQLVAGGPSQPTLLTQNSATVDLAVSSSASSALTLTDAVGREAFGNVFDVPTDNGVFHVIDRVLMPAGILTVLQTVLIDPERFQGLASTVGAAASVPAGQAFVQAANGAGPVTLFAPVNQAFVDAATVTAGLSPEQLTTVLAYHTVPQSLTSPFAFGTSFATVAGPSITINAGVAPALATIDDSTATDAKVIAVNIIASNGVVHVIDKVLIPPAP